MPLDVIPDFIPILGQLDDVFIVLIGLGLLLRFTPRGILEEHLARLERTQRRPRQIIEGQRDGA
jgi:uncharacterized membrane protein YkvA (DUF1232 family)